MGQLARGRVGKYLLLAASLLLALLVAELFLRIYESRFVDRGVRLSATGVDLGANNFNDGFVSFVRPEDQFRVLSLGDSFAYGIVRYPWTYHAVLGERAGDDLDKKTMRVVNLGEPAISFAEYIVNYRFWAERLEHDAVLFLVFVGNDLLLVRKRDTEDINRTFADMGFGIGEGERRLGVVPERFGFRLVDYAYAVWKTRSSQLPERDEPDERYNLAALNIPESQFQRTQTDRLQNYDPATRALAAGFEQAEQFFRAVAEIRGQGLKVLVALAPDQLQVDEVLRADVLRRAGAAGEEYDFEWPNRGLFAIRDAVDPEIAMIDLLPFFACESGSGAGYYRPRDTHWSVEGNRVAGEAIAEAVRWYWFEGTDEAMPSSACNP